MNEENTMLTGLSAMPETVVSEQTEEAIKLHQHIYECAVTASSALFDMGASLKHMRDGKLYAALGYETFGEYVENNGDYSFRERQAYNYIKVVESYSEKFLQSNADIGVTKLELLTKLENEDRAEIIAENDIAGMTVDEVKQLIKEKQALCEQLSFFEEEIEKIKTEKTDSSEVEELQRKLDETAERIKELEQQSKTAEEESKSAVKRVKLFSDTLHQKDSEIAMLKEELNAKKEEAEPRELSEEEIAEIRKSIRGEIQAEQDEKISALKIEQDKQLDKLKAEYEAKTNAVESEKALLEEKLKSGTADEARAALKVYFEETQKNVTAFVDRIKQLDDAETRQKFIVGAVKWLKMIVVVLEND
jgi:chromosome segregation ATPase